MAGERRRFSREFKVEAVCQVLEGPRSMNEVARDLDLSPGVLSRWVRQYREDSDLAFPGQSHQLPDDEELRRLRRELADVREERDILKKALVVFSRREPK